MESNQDQKYYSLFKNIDLGVVYQDKTGRIIDANAAAEDMLGLSVEQMNKMDSGASERNTIKENGDFFAKKDYPGIRALASGEVVKGVVMGLMHPIKKKRVWIKITAIPEFEDGCKEPSGVMATLEDINKQFDLQQQIQEKELEFRALFNNGPIGVAYHKLVYNKKGIADNFIIIDVNDNFIKHVGVDPRGMLVKDALPTFKDEPWDWIGELCKCGQFGETIRFERELTSIKKWFSVVAYKSSDDHFVTAFFDVTKEHQLQKEIREKAFLVESSSTPIIMADLDHTIKYANTSFLKIWGYGALSEVLGRPVIEFWKLNDPFDEIVQVIYTSGSYEDEAKGIKKSGALFDVRSKASAVLDESAVPIGIMASSEDLTEITKIKESQIASENKFRLLFERSTNAIFLVDLETGFYLDGNAAAVKLTGRSIEDLKQYRTADISPLKAKERLQTMGAYSEVVQFGEVDYVRPDGSIRNAVLNVVPIGDNKVFGIATEITEQKTRENDIKSSNKELFETSAALTKSNVELEDAIRSIERSRAKVTSIIENTTNSIWAIDSNYDIIYINHVFKKEFKRTFGVDLSVGTNLVEAIPDPIRMMWRDRYDRALNNEQFVFEDRIEVAPDVFIYIQVSMNSIISNGKVIGASFFGSDITRRKQIEVDIIDANRELQKTTLALTQSNDELEVALAEASRSKALALANKKLKEKEKALNELHKESQNLNTKLMVANEQLSLQKNELEQTLIDLKLTQSQLVQSEKMASMGTLTAGVAHELNNPLNFINGSAQIFEMYIDDELQSHKENLKQFIDNIYVGVDRASEIIKSLNHFSRKNEESDLICSVHVIIDNCLTMLNNQIKYKGKVETNYTDVDFCIIGNEGKLHQIFVNILSNAIDAIDNDGLIIINTFVKQKVLNVQIEDNGSGINADDLNRIMDPFFTTKPPGKGTGLGLSIVYSILEEHKATIQYESALNKGTKVLIKFPIIKK